MRPKTIRVLHVLAFVLIEIVAVSNLTTAQTKGPILRFTATTENVGGAGDSVRIDLLGWSTDADRDRLASAWTTPRAPAAPPVVARGGAVPAAGRGGGGGGRGGGGAPAPAVPETPASALLAALQRAPTVGILWTSESVGYSLRYAYRLPLPDSGERIILATDRRLGAWNTSWKPVGPGSPTDYEFTLIELRVNSKGEGEGKASLIGQIAVDSPSKTIALDGYSTLSVVLKGVKRQQAS